MNTFMKNDAVMILKNLRPWLIIACTALMIYTNLFGGGGSGFTEDRSDPGMYYAFPTPFSPAPFTFAIWLPIFIGCSALAIYQAMPSQIRNPQLDRFALPYCSALLANASTPFLKIGWSNIVVTFLFVCLCFAVLVLVQKNKGNLADTLFLRVPTVIFATWCGLAMIVNLCQWMVSIGMPISLPFTVGLVCAAMTLGILAMIGTRQCAIACVMIWAGIGICYAQPSWNIVSTSVALTSVLTVVVAAWIVFGSARSMSST